MSQIGHSKECPFLLTKEKEREFFKLAAQWLSARLGVLHSPDFKGAMLGEHDYGVEMYLLLGLPHKQYEQWKKRQK